MVVHFDAFGSNSSVKVIGQSSRSWEENVPFSAESDNEIGKTSSGNVAEKADPNWKL